MIKGDSRRPPQKLREQVDRVADEHDGRRCCDAQPDSGEGFAAVDNTASDLDLLHMISQSRMTGNRAIAPRQPPNRAVRMIRTTIAKIIKKHPKAFMLALLIE